MINYSANLVILFPLAISLFVAIRMGEGMIGGSRTGWARVVTYTMIGLMVALAVAGLLIRIGPISLVWVGGLAILLTIISIRSRALNRSAMYQSFVAVDTDQQRQQIAQDFINYNAGSVRRRAIRFLFGIEKLGDWSAALEQSRIALTPYEKLSCRVRQRYGEDVDQVLSPLSQSSRIQQEAERLLARMYPIPIALVGFLVLGLVLWLIVPTVIELQQEFGLELPSSLLLVVSTADWLKDTGLGALLTLLLFTVFAAFAFCVVAWIFPSLTQHYPLRIFTQSYYRSFGLLSLSIALRHQSNANEACHSAATLMPVKFISERLKRSGLMIQQGMPPAKALCNASLISKQQSTLLGGSEKSRSFPWSIESLAVSMAEKTLRYYSISSQLAVVICILILAAIYGFAARSIIEVLVQLILNTARLQ